MLDRLRDLFIQPTKRGPYTDQRQSSPFFTSYDPFGPYLLFNKMNVLGSVPT